MYHMRKESTSIKPYCHVYTNSKYKKMFFGIQLGFMKHTSLQIRTGHTFYLATTNQYLASPLEIL